MNNEERIDYEKLDNDILLDKYHELIASKNYYVTDLEYTEKALKDVYIDYLTKKEYSNDIIYDRHEIERINRKIEAIKPILIRRNLLEDEKVLVKKYKIGA